MNVYIRLILFLLMIPAVHYAMPFLLRYEDPCLNGLGAMSIATAVYAQYFSVLRYKANKTYSAFDFFGTLCSLLSGLLFIFASHGGNTREVVVFAVLDSALILAPFANVLLTRRRGG